MIKIGEFARINSVTVKTLRFYEKKGLLLPSEVDPYTGYRYYSVNQIQILCRIIALRDVGFSLNEINVLIKKNISNDEMIYLLSERKSSLESSIALEKSKLSSINHTIKLLELEKKTMHNITIKTVEGIKVASYRGIGKDYGDQETHWNRVMSHLEKHNAKNLLGCFVCYHTDQNNDGVDIEVFEVIDKDIPSSEDVSVRDLPKVDEMASVVINGPYSLLKGGYEAIYSWITDNNYKVDGVAREIYLGNESNTKCEDEYVTEIQIPVKRVNLKS